MRRWTIVAALFLLPLLGLPAAASAHSFGLSLLELGVGDAGVEAVLTTDLGHLDAAAALDGNGDRRVSARELEAGRAAVAGYLTDRLRLSGPAGACAASLVSLQHDAPRTAAIAALRYDCAAALGPLEVESRLFAEQPGAHRLMTVIVEDGRRLRADLDRREPRLRYEATPPDAPAPVAQTDPRLEPDSAWRVARRYLGLGLEHIALGFDHLLFLLTLLLAARRLRTLAALVTAFTLAHSATLALAVLGVARAPAVLVEALIAASIVLVAVENVVREAARRRGPEARVLGLGAEPRGRVALVFALGLVHGFGFAGVLAGLGLGRDELGVALVAFNAGVELGQLALVLATWPLLRLAMRWPGYPRLVQVLSGVIALVGVFWLVERLS